MYTRLSNIPQNELIPGFNVRFVHGNNMTTAHWNIDEGALLPEHSHAHEQIAIVTEGKFELTIEGKSTVCESGGVMVIPSNAIHSGRALTDCKIIDIFAPVREDYK
ncbi:cupin domain-containing protein [Winogradskyella sp. 3972H.M.0a.05]|uniref:cupin domain-containing protein n=1 Tax=Winogradskyella sp. 3972H.M.0a.05 TaxID=2950277 RepID=UPI0033982FCF